MNKISLDPNLGVLFLRLIVGLSMAFAHGLSKVPPPDKFIEGVGAMGFPLPLVFAWSAGLSELLGGLFIALGLWTRLSSLMMGFTMLIAAFVAHAADPFAKKEMALLYLASCLLLIFQGPGRFSLDQWRSKKK